MGENHLVAPLELIDTNDGEPIQPTTKGQMVKCVYSLDVTCEMEGCMCCNSPPRVEVPIQIYAPQVVFSTIQQPEGWAPQMMDTKKVVFSDAYFSQKGG